MTECDILAFTAHPDDMELNCGGTLALSARQGWKAGAIDFTRGELSTRGTIDQRNRESEEAARVLGLAFRANLELPDGHLHDTDENRKVVVRWIRLLRPKVLIAPPVDDHHADHMAVGEILHRSFYFAGVARYLPEMEPWRPNVLLHYVGSRAAVPHLVVDVSSVAGARMQAIRSYESQFHPRGAGERATRISHPDFLQAIEAISRRHGALIGASFGEAYTVKEPVPVTDLVSLYSRTPWEHPKAPA